MSASNPQSCTSVSTGYIVMNRFSVVQLWIGGRPKDYIVIVGFGVCYRYLAFKSVVVDCRAIARRVIWRVLDDNAKRFVAANGQNEYNFNVRVLCVYRGGGECDLTTDQILAIEQRLATRPSRHDQSGFDEAGDVWNQNCCGVHLDRE